MKITLLLSLIFICLLPKIVNANDKKSIKLGATLALSGKLAFVGQAQQRGLSIAVSDVNRAGGVNGHKLELIIEDNQGDPKHAVDDTRKLLDVDRVEVLFSAFTHITHAIKGIVAQHNKTMIYAATHTGIVSENSRFFNDFPDSKALGKLLGDHLKNRYKKLFYFSEIGDACMVYEEALLDTIKEGKAKFVAHDGYSPGELDFRSQILRIKSKKPDALVLCSWRDGHTFMRQYAEMGMLDIPVFAAWAPFLPVADTTEMRKLYEKNATISTWYGFLESSLTPNEKKFYDRYKADYKEHPRPDTFYFYDNIQMLATALKPCTKTTSEGVPLVDQDCLARELALLHHNGISSLVSFTSNRIAQRNSIFLMQVKNGNWEKLE